MKEGEWKGEREKGKKRTGTTRKRKQRGRLYDCILPPMHDTGTGSLPASMMP